MGTSSLTVFYDENNLPICAMNLPMDGYPDGHGYQLAEFLRDHREMSMGQLAAACVASFLSQMEEEDGAELVSPNALHGSYHEWEYSVFTDVVKVCDVNEDKTCTAEWKTTSAFENLCTSWDDTAADAADSEDHEDTAADPEDDE